MKPYPILNDDAFAMLLVPALGIDTSEIPSYDASLAFKRRFNHMFAQHASKNFMNFRKKLNHQQYTDFNKNLLKACESGKKGKIRQMLDEA